MANQQQDFDLKGAREAGATDKDIADHLAGKVGFKLEEARQSGAKEVDIIQHLMKGKAFREVSAPVAFSEGISTGLSDLVSTIGGAPVDIMAEIQRQTLGRITPLLDPGDKPFLGSKSIRSGLEAVGARSFDRSELSPEMRPFAIGGEVIGGSIPMAAVPFGIPARIASKYAFLKPIVGFATDSPKRFLVAEAAAAGGAAVGGALAEFVDPGDEMTRFFSEVAGGIFSPVAALSKIGGKSVDSVRTLLKSFTKSGREDKAAEIIQAIMKESGENPEDVIKLLQKADLAGPKLTAGLKTGSPSLIAIEKKLSELSVKFSGELGERTTNSLGVLRDLTDDLVKSGDPQAVRAAAKLRSQYFDTLLEKRLESAGQDVLELRSKLTGSKKDIGKISRKSKDILDDALRDARKAETEIWGKIDKSMPIGTNNLLNSVDKVTSDFFLEIKDLPVSVQRGTKALLDNAATVDDALKFRSHLLKLSRGANVKGDFVDKNIFDTLADGILVDLGDLPGDVAVEAREFSRALHEKFTDTFASDALQLKRRGGDRIPAELLLDQAFGSGGTKADLRLRELSEAADFPNELFGKPILGEQEKFLNIAAQNTIDESGRVSSQKLEAFVDNNQNTLERFPELKTKLSNIIEAEDAFRGVEQATKKASDAITRRAAFSNLLQTDDPVVAVGQVLTGKNTNRSFTQLARLAKKSGEGAILGLRSSTLKNAFDAATNSVGGFDFKRLDEVLKSGLGKEKQSLINLMLQNGVIDTAAANRIKMITKRGVEIQGALNDPKKISALLENPDGMFDLVTRLVGADLGRLGPGSGAGASHIKGQAGSRFSRNLFGKIPGLKITEVIEEGALNNDVMVMLLKKTKTIKQKRQIERQMNAFLVGSGLQLDEREKE